VSLVELPLKNYISGYQEGEYADKSILWHSSEQFRWNRERRFRGSYCHHHQRNHPSQSLMTSEASGYSDDVTEGCHPCSFRCHHGGGGGLALHMVTKNDMQSALHVLFTFLDILRSTTARHLPHSTLFHPAENTSASQLEAHQVGPVELFPEISTEPQGSIKNGQFLDQLGNVTFSRRTHGEGTRGETYSFHSVVRLTRRPCLTPANGCQVPI
jgi:hypothetical protein